MCSEIINHGMDTPNEIPDHDIENGLLLDQIKDYPTNDDEIDEATVLEIDQTTNTTNYTNINQQHAKENNLFGMMNLNDSIIESYPNTLQTTHEYLTIEQHETDNNDDSGINTQNTTPGNHSNPTKKNNDDSERTPTNTNTEQQDSADRNDMDIEETNNGTSTNSALQQADPTNIDIKIIPNQLLESFRTLYTLKHKRDKQQATIDNLTKHHNSNTTPEGLRVKHKCKLYLPLQFRERWERILNNASNAPLEVILDYHQ